MVDSADDKALKKFAADLLGLIGRRLRQKAHTQVIIVIRDGKIQFFREDRTYLPNELPDS